MTTFSLPQSTARRRMPSAHAPKQNAIPSNGPAPELGSAPMLLDIDRLEPHPDNPRDDLADDDEELLALVESLKATKLINPIQVEQISLNAERYRILCGERRWRAAKLAGWSTIPAVICRLNRPEALSIMADENLARANLNPIEEAKMLAMLNRPIAEGGAGLSFRQIAARYPFTKSGVHRRLALLTLPDEWQQRVARGEIGITEGDALAAYRETPAVFAAVALDWESHPEEWGRAPDDAGGERRTNAYRFVNRLGFVAERIGTLAKWQYHKEPASGVGWGKTNPGVAAEAPNDQSKATEGADGAEQSPIGRGAVRRSAPVNHQVQPPPTDACTGPHRDQTPAEARLAGVIVRVLDLLDQVATGDLRFVQRYLRNRSRECVGAEARKGAIPPLAEGE